METSMNCKRTGNYEDRDMKEQNSYKNKNESRRAYEDNAKPFGSRFLHVSTGI